MSELDTATLVVAKRVWDELMRREFSAVVREKAFRRAQYRCQRCGARYPLELHHVGGHGDVSLFNALVLCVECHTKIHQVENARGRMGWRT
jgi:5-methylcytosine-specific restriction endonuclease McrA